MLIWTLNIIPIAIGVRRSVVEATEEYIKLTQISNAVGNKDRKEATYTYCVFTRD